MYKYVADIVPMHNVEVNMNAFFNRCFDFEYMLFDWKLPPVDPDIFLLFKGNGVFIIRYAKFLIEWNPKLIVLCEVQDITWILIFIFLMTLLICLFIQFFYYNSFHIIIDKHHYIIGKVFLCSKERFFVYFIIIFQFITWFLSVYDILSIESKLRKNFMKANSF